MELKICGHFDSWRNKGIGDARTASRINRAFGNSEWHTTYSSSLVEYINPGLSDYSRIVLRFDMITKKGGRPFENFNDMADHADFLQVVADDLMIFTRGDYKSTRMDIKAL